MEAGRGVQANPSPPEPPLDPPLLYNAMDCVISELCNKGTVLQRNYRKIPIPIIPL